MNLRMSPTHFHIYSAKRRKMPIDYLDPDLYVFPTTLIAFLFLTLTVVSVPMEESYSFLHSTQANGVSFGMWGWCLDDGLTCSPIHRFGYTWPPEIDTPITKSFVLYLIAYALTFFTLIAAFLALCARKGRNFDQIFNILAWSSFFTSATATIFSIAIYSTAKSAFEEHGFGATYGLLAWISPITTMLLSLVALRAYYHVLLSKKARKQCSTATSGDVES